MEVQTGLLLVIKMCFIVGGTVTFLLNQYNTLMESYERLGVIGLLLFIVTILYLTVKKLIKNLREQYEARLKEKDERIKDLERNQ